MAKNAIAEMKKVLPPTKVNRTQNNTCNAIYMPIIRHDKEFCQMAMNIEARENAFRYILRLEKS